VRWREEHGYSIFFPATPMPAVPFKKSLASDTEQCMEHAVAACLIRTGRDGHPPLSLPSWGCHCAVAVNKVIYLISFTCHCLSRAIKSRANRRNDMEHGKKQRKHEKEKGHEQKGCVFRRLDLIMEMLQSSYGTVILQEFGWILDVESFVLKKGLHRIFFPHIGFKPCEISQLFLYTKASLMISPMQRT